MGLAGPPSLLSGAERTAGKAGGGAGGLERRYRLRRRQLRRWPKPRGESGAWSRALAAEHWRDVETHGPCGRAGGGPGSRPSGPRSACLHTSPATGAARTAPPGTPGRRLCSGPARRLWASVTPAEPPTGGGAGPWELRRPPRVSPPYPRPGDLPGTQPLPCPRFVPPPFNLNSPKAWPKTFAICDSK